MYSLWLQEIFKYSKGGSQIFIAGKRKILNFTRSYEEDIGAVHNLLFLNTGK